MLYDSYGEERQPAFTPLFF